MGPVAGDCAGDRVAGDPHAPCSRLDRFWGKALAEAFRGLIVGFFSLVLAIALIIFAPKIIDWIIHFVQDPQAATSGLPEPPKATPDMSIHPQSR
jgi:hypothetical protein